MGDVKIVKNFSSPIFFFSLLLCLTLTGNDEIYYDYQVKSTFIYRICKFTQWPNPSDPSKPFIISILGETLPGKEIVFPETQCIQKRKVLIRKIRLLSEIEDSDALFITSSEESRLDLILEYIGDKPILTFGDTRGFAQRGVIINFFIKGKRVSFEINHEASKKASLGLNSQLYAIGKVIKPGEKKK